MQLRQFKVHNAYEDRHWWFTARRKIIRNLIETLLPPSNDTLIVEIGCGTGGNIADLSSGYSCVGIDIDSAAIELAQKRFPSLRLVHGIAPQDILDDLRRASVVLLLDVLEHVQEDCELLSRVLKVLRPGAYVIITVPAGQDLWSEHDVSFGHWRRYDKSTLEALWEGEAVSPLLCSYFNSRLYRPIKLVRQCNRFLGRASGTAGTDFFLPTSLVNSLLYRVFAAESRVLVKALLQSTPTSFRHGVSLVSVLRRETLGVS